MNGEITFGRWLRQRRQALDLTQEELADRIGCSSETIRKIEVGRRLPSRQLVELLAEDLGVPPDEREDLIRMARSGVIRYQEGTMS